STQIPLNLVVRSDESYDQPVWRCSKENASRQANTALKEIRAQFSYSKASVSMRLTEGFAQLEQFKNGAGALFFRKSAQLLLVGGIEEKRFFQEPLSGCRVKG